MPVLGEGSLEYVMRSISPFLEMGAYETLWCEDGASVRSLALKFKERPTSRPSDWVGEEDAVKNGEYVLDRFERSGVNGFGVQVHGYGEYPPTLRDAVHPVEVMYYEGWWDLVFSPSVAVVGTRKPSDNGIKRARELVRQLVKDGDYTIFSGLAMGIDRTAHETALEAGGRTVAVLGTPLSHAYPKEHRELQRRIAEEFLVVSQVPVRRWYERRGPHRFFFPERNATMSALTEATIVVEAGETSGTLHQVQAAHKQGRQIFILDECFHNPNLTWPHVWERRGAIRVRSYDDIKEVLSSTVHEDRPPDNFQPSLFD